MFFPLSKVLGFFALPSNLVIVAGLIGVLLLLTRFRRTGRVLVVASLLLLAIFGLSPLGNALMIPLEDRFPPWTGSGDVAGIIVLGGAVSPDVSAARNEVSLNELAERLTAAALLAAAYPRAKIVFAGGDAGLVRVEGAEAPFAARLLRELGVAPGRIIVEDRSRNTAENAAFANERAAPKKGERWLLVTSGYHMPRGSASSAARASRSSLSRSTGARAALPTRCGRSCRSATGSGAPTPPCANGSASSSTG